MNVEKPNDRGRFERRNYGIIANMKLRTLLGAVAGGFALSLLFPACVNSSADSLPQTISLTMADSQTLLAECSLDGKKCLMSFDTGNPFTFFYKSFIDRELPEAKLEPTGKDRYLSNVLGKAYWIKPKEFCVGGIPWGSPRYGVVEHAGTNKLDVGVIGMERLFFTSTPAIISVGDRKVTFFPSNEDLAGFGEPVGVLTNGHFFVETQYRGKKLWMLLDTGSGETYLTDSTGWPKTPFSYVAHGNNYAGEVATPGFVGELETLDLGGMPFEMQPNVIARARKDLLPYDDIAVVGLDTLKRYDILVTGEPPSRKVSLRRNASVPPRGFAFSAAMCLPKTDATKEFSIPVVARKKGFDIVECEIDGKPCRMAVDGQYEISFIDCDFAKRAFPNAKLFPPNECAMWQPEYAGVSGQLMHVGSMKIGGVAFSDFVIRQNDVARQMGLPVDGLLGLSTLKGFKYKFGKGPDGKRRIVFKPVAQNVDAAKSVPVVEVAVSVVEAKREAFESVGVKLGEAKQLDAAFDLGEFLKRTDVEVLAAPKLLEKSGRKAEKKIITEYTYPTRWNVKLSDGFEDMFGKDALEKLREAGRRMGERNLKLTIGKLDCNTNGVPFVLEPEDFTMTEVGVAVTVTPTLKDGVVELGGLSVSVVDEPTWTNYGLTLTKQGASYAASYDMPMEYPHFRVEKVERDATRVPIGTTVAIRGRASERREKGKVWLLVFVTPKIS